MMRRQYEKAFIGCHRLDGLSKSGMVSCVFKEDSQAVNIAVNNRDGRDRRRIRRSRRSVIGGGECSSHNGFLFLSECSW